MTIKAKQPGHVGRPGVAHHFARLTNDQVFEIRLRRRNGEKIVSIAEDYPVCDAHISDIINRKRWKHIH